MRFRDAGPGDAERIARHHADSWRRHYRGGRLAPPTANESTTVVEIDPACTCGVLEQNVAARAFYAARGGTEVERVADGPAPGGSTAPELRVVGPDATALLTSGDRAES